MITVTSYFPSSTPTLVCFCSHLCAGNLFSAVGELLHYELTQKSRCCCILAEEGGIEGQSPHQHFPSSFPKLPCFISRHPQPDGCDYYLSSLRPIPDTAGLQKFPLAGLWQGLGLPGIQHVIGDCLRCYSRSSISWVDAPLLPDRQQFQDTQHRWSPRAAWRKEEHFSAIAVSVDCQSFRSVRCGPTVMEAVSFRKGTH